MAATFNESQKIDYLWKKVGYGVAKTAEPTSKEAFNESIASPLLYRGDLVWTSSGDIPATPPTNTTSLVQVYKDGGGGGYSPTVECTEDLTAPDNQTWKTNLTNWVPTQFGDNYLVQVYVANSGNTTPQTSGTKLFAAGSGNDDTWFFDYQAGILNFNGANIPSQITGGITGKSIYIVGYRYVGPFGVGGSTPTQIVSGTSNVSVVSSGGNVSVGVGGTGNVAVFSTTGVSVTGNITGNYFIGNGSQLTGISTSGGSNISNGTSNVNIATANGNVTIGVAGTSNVAVFTNTGVSLTGNVTANYFVGNGSALTSVMADRGTDPNNWNTLTQMGVYTVNRVSWSGTVGTPLDSQVFVGLLEVKNSTDTALEQIFFPGTVENTDQKIQWNRAYWSGTWTSWIKIVNDYQTVAGGEF
jgi:hypothetical protein